MMLTNPTPPHSPINFSSLILVSSFSLTARSYRENNCKSCIPMSKSLTIYVSAHFFIYFDCELIINRNHARVPLWGMAGMWWARCHRPAPTASFLRKKERIWDLERHDILLLHCTVMLASIQCCCPQMKSLFFPQLTSGNRNGNLHSVSLHLTHLAASFRCGETHLILSHTDLISKWNGRVKKYNNEQEQHFHQF